MLGGFQPNSGKNAFVEFWDSRRYPRDPSRTA